MRRFALFAAPASLALAVAVAPLVGGGRTLFLRDVFNTHLPMKQAEAEALRAGHLPLVDPYRAGGQPLAGNPNAVPLYPDNALYRIAPTLWALNAHFWLHLLIAPFAMFWLGRRLGLSREAAWAAGVVYATSGYVLSNLCFYNLIAGVALAPGLIAALLETTGERPGRGAVATAVLWALLLLGGEPLLAGVALALAVGAGLTMAGWRRVHLLRVGLALLVGTLLAAPQLVELLRILPLSFRGHFGYGGGSGTVESFDPRQALEWLLPFPFGRLDRLGDFWGSRFYTDRPPYYPALYPGLLALALLAASGRPAGRRAAWWAWGSVGLGVGLALGRFNPLAAWLFGSGTLRYPIKLWLAVAIGGAVLCGLGYERTLQAADGAARRPLGRALAGLALILLLGWLALVVRAGAARSLLRTLIPGGFGGAFVEHERLRWAGLCLVSLAALALLALLVRMVGRRPALGGVLLTVHAGLQLWLLRPLYPTDDVASYREPPALLAEVPPEARVVHGSFLDLFGPNQVGDGQFPAPELRWVERRAFAELFPFAGPLFGRRYELNCSAEGLDSFLARVAQGAVANLDDVRRVRLLRAFGVDRLLLERPLEPAAEGLVRLLRAQPSYGREIRVYAIEGAPAVFLAAHVRYAPDINAAIAQLVRPEFDASTSTVLAGDRVARDWAPGVVRLLGADVESLVAEVVAPAGGVLVVERSHLPIYRAWIDGRPAPLLVANLYRMGVEVPAGTHLVRIATDRRPLVAGLALAALAALALAGLPRLVARLGGE